MNQCMYVTHGLETVGRVHLKYGRVTQIVHIPPKYFLSGGPSGGGLHRLLLRRRRWGYGFLSGSYPCYCIFKLIFLLMHTDAKKRLFSGRCFFFVIILNDYDRICSEKCLASF